jgi:polyribonucleotide nucleotidyltransferase
MAENTENTENTENAETEDTKADPAMDAIKAAFQAEMEKENVDEDSVKMAMLLAGAKFANVARYFNQLMVECGFAKSKEERNEILDKLLSGLDLTVEATFDEALSKLMEALDTNDRSAATSIRMWCKKNEVEFFKKPKSEPGEGRKGFTAIMYKWVVDNINATKDEFEEFLNENLKTENQIKYKQNHLAFFKVVQEIKAIYQSA